MRVSPIAEHVREILAAADPYYRGPRRGTQPLIDETVRPLDPAKTRRDLGRIDLEHGGAKGERFDLEPTAEPTSKPTARRGQLPR